MAGVIWHAANYSYRALITVPTASTTADSFVWVPQAWWDAFWTTVLSTGFDVRFYDGNGGGPVQHERATWTYASKIASFEVLYADAFGATDYSEFYWVYWGFAAATDSSAATPTVGPVTETMAPILTPPAGRLVVARTSDPGAETPPARISKTTAETITVWWDITAMLGELGETFYTRKSAIYALLNVDWDAATGTGVYVGGVRDPAGAPDTTQADTLAFEDAEGRTYIGITYTGGTDGGDYTASLRFTVDAVSQGVGPTSQILEAVALIQVRNPSE
jgi:hypothetical protein